VHEFLTLCTKITGHPTRHAQLLQPHWHNAAYVSAIIDETKLLQPMTSRFAGTWWTRRRPRHWTTI